ncbi:response regulator transcription factor [Dactylosporangium vinaceum]|uniref:LuxR C-terminal-related transcriptional regulator n=1 Tax=Dactylosporangium vinaceum TaxID=53362 RepID=A0ABV5M5K0_9ACTN|nr:response regulator transcription factor [Dactylosporangium vinaceum]UAB95548.1 response regulator transcription factor [Dactylosporangium vinaceum]
MKVAIADDHGIFRDSVARALRDIDVTVPICVGSGDELLAWMQSEPVDVAIVDVRFGDDEARRTAGLATARKVKEQFPGVAVLVLTMQVATAQAISLLRDFPTGIGYLQKDEVASVEDLLPAFDRLLAGEQVVGRSVVDLLLRSTAQTNALTRLSEQERNVLRLMAEGLTNGGIARRLNLSARAIEDHVSRVFDKLGIRTGDGNPRVLAVITWLRLSRPAS